MWEAKKEEEEKQKVRERKSHGLLPLSLTI